MRKNKGFTLIELMVVILIVAILAAVLAPLMTGRIHAAKWSEGVSGAGTIVTALRAYIAEHEGAGTLVSPMDAAGEYVPIGITDGDLAGKYFTVGCYATTFTVVTAGNPAVTTTTITIVITAPAALGFVPATKTLTVTHTSDGVTHTSVWS